MFKLEFKKSFTPENITQEMAAELCRIICSNNEYSVDKGYVFKIISIDPVAINDKRTSLGIEIFITKPNSEFGSQPWRVVIFNSGMAWARKEIKKGEVKYYFIEDSKRGIPPKTEYYKTNRIVEQKLLNPVKLIEFFLNYGFLGIKAKIKA